MSFADGMTQSVVGIKTAVETPAEMFAAASPLSGRTRMRITNLSTHTRARIGRVSANLQRDGDAIEPQDTITVFPSVAIFGCSEGAAINLQIEEN